MDLYEILNVLRDADQVAIKKAYRKLASKHHTDKGGDDAKMAQVNVAYETLSDPNKRERYDRTGEIGNGPGIYTEAENMICSAFDGAIERCDDYTDAVKVIVDTLANKTEEVQKAINAGERKIGEIEKRRTRVRRKGGGTDLYERVISHKLRMAQQKKAQDEHHLLVIQAGQKIIADYECSVKTVDPKIADTLEKVLRAEYNRHVKSFFSFDP
jgi:curved DNA-binding protein CbpA